MIAFKGMNAMSRLTHALKLGLDTLFPNFCIGCNSHINPNHALCSYCLQDLSLFDLERHPNLLHRPDVCDAFPDCQLDHLIACAWYQAPLNQWLKQLKFNDQQYYKIALQQIISQQLAVARKVNIHWPDAFIIMPLHKQRFLTRGFNQVSQTWLPVLQRQNEPIISPLQKLKATKAQSKLSKTNRIKNLKGAFICQQDLSAKTVAIIDDVMTSGATLNAATKVIKEAGAKQVWAMLTCLTPLGAH
jgi:ComF family protein